ncbi:NACHT domain- and WD repeat-containing protein 1 isoform X1 [Oryctolagus cuniculus]|uniref:NACHT domain- and WD repeat-containing protein 1 isoform X1 n=2 Tax=Oryctolagus cuniculus TaxID=9986 RepID=UPI00387A1163
MCRIAQEVGCRAPLAEPARAGFSANRAPSPADMEAEREFLQRSAYPELRIFCQKHGLVFEAVDLRWGIREPEATALLTPDLCLEELGRCQQTSTGPAFVVPGAEETRGPEEATLASVLYAGAQEAWRRGRISEEQWHRYHWSVTAWELELGLLRSAAGAQGATVFVREIADLHRHLLEDCAVPTADRLPDGCPDLGAQALLSSLKGRVAEAHPDALRSHRLPWSRDLGTRKSRAHAPYLQQLSEQFVARATHQVLRHLRELEAPAPLGSAWLYREICHHLRQSAELTRTFCGRRELLAQLGRRLNDDDGRPHPPLVLWGPPGVGSSALMCRLAERISSAPGLLPSRTVTVLRLLGTSPLSRDTRGLLPSLCFQVCLAYGLPPPPAQVLAAHCRVVQFFHALLHTVSCRNFESLVLLLDSVDDLDPGRWPQRMPWLPARCPPRVHLVLSACSGPGGRLESLRETLGDPDSYWEVQPLSGNQGREMMELLLTTANRTLSRPQRDLLWASLPECGHPGRLRLAFEEARQWASFTTPAPLAATPEEATHQLCARLEQTHGRLLVAHVLGYIVCSRHGLSEAELKDILSLDDEVLQAVYQEWTPPSKELLRFPPLLWVRLRRDLGHCLARRPGDGCTLLAIAHRQLAQVIRQRYLSGPEGARRHSVLADFFSGAWSQGTKKLITLPLVGRPLNLDRQPAPQPLWFSDSAANLRKLHELPWHLLHAGRLAELKQEVLGNLSWISCRAESGGIESLLDDFRLCAPPLGCPEADLIRGALQLCRPAVELRGAERSILYTELLARLHFFSTSHPALVGQLCQQAQSWFRACPHPVLVPLAGFLQPPGGPLRATLTGCHKGITALAWSPDEELLVVGTQDGTVVVWDTEEQQVVHFLSGHSGEVRGLRVFCAGRSAVSASSDRTLRLWDLRRGWEKSMFQEGSLPAPAPCAWSLHVDEAGGVLYSAPGSQISAWNLESAQLVFRVLGDPADPWLCTAVLASPARLLAVSRAGVVRLWHSATGSLQGEHRVSGIAEETPTCAILAQKQGKVVTGFSDGSVSLVSAQEDRLREKLPDAVGFLVLSEDESLLAAGFGRCVRILLADGRGFHRFLAADLKHEDVVETAVFGPQNNLLVTGSRDALIQVWSLSEQGRLLDVLQGIGAPVSLLARAGALVASASPLSSSCQVWDLRAAHRPRAAATFPGRTGLTAVSHNGSFVYFPKVGERHAVSVWDVAEGEEQDALDTSSEVRCLEVAEEAKLLFTGLASGVVLVFPLHSRQDVMCIPPPEARRAVNCMALSKSEKWLAVAYDSVVLVLAIGPGEPCPVIEGPTYTISPGLPEPIASVAVLADSRVLYGTAAGGLFLHECASSRGVPLEAHGSRVGCVDVSHGEQLAVSGSGEALLCLWDLQARRWKFQMSCTSSYCGGVQCARFSKDDEYVYAGMKDCSVTVWSALDGTLLAVQFVHTVVDRIIPTAGGFLAPSRHGYLIRERFQRPAARTSQQEPLHTFQKAAWMVRARQREQRAAAAGAPGASGSERAPGKESTPNRRSQVCVIV